jgi:hypothetical protein
MPQPYSYSTANSEEPKKGLIALFEQERWTRVIVPAVLLAKS